MQPELACVVMALAGEPGLLDAVRSLVEQVPPVEVVVVEAGGGGARALTEAALGVPVVALPGRRYPGALRNAGIDATTAPFVAFLAADCVARPGWSAGRLREHRRGAVAVAGSLVNASPCSAAACASLLLLHNRMLAGTEPGERLYYGLSYARGLFERHGRFREDLRAGEDTDFNARLAGCRIVAPPDVLTAHRYPTSVRALLADSHRRGRLRAAMQGLLDDGGSRKPQRAGVAVGVAPNVVRAVRAARRVPERRTARRARPLVVLAGIAYAAGALGAGATRYDGYDSSLAPPVNRATRGRA